MSSPAHSRSRSSWERRRASCGSLRATVSDPPWCQSQSICSPATTSPISRHGRLDRARHGAGSTAAAPAPPSLRPPRQLPDYPPAVAPGGAEPRVARLEHDDLQRRVGAAQLVCGPQPREAGADDADVGLVDALEPRARHRSADLLEPERRRRRRGGRRGRARSIGPRLERPLQALMSPSLRPRARPRA